MASDHGARNHDVACSAGPNDTGGRDAYRVPMDKTIETTFPVHELIARRWSPRAFAADPVSSATLGSLLEAARWAPSCFNEQPWTYLVATKDDAEAFERLASCLVDANGWAKAAPVLVLSVAQTSFARNGKPNRHALHDVGLATENLVLEAVSHGLVSHQMAGFDVERAREVTGLPQGHEPVAMIAIGHPGDPAALPAPLAERESAPRVRKELQQIAYGSRWGDPAPLG